jgi:hypothetical protein
MREAKQKGGKQNKMREAKQKGGKEKKKKRKKSETPPVLQ